MKPVQTILIVAAKQLISVRMTGNESIEDVAKLVHDLRTKTLDRYEQTKLLRATQRLAARKDIDARMAEIDAWICVYGDMKDAP